MILVFQERWCPWTGPPHPTPRGRSCADLADIAQGHAEGHPSRIPDTDLDDVQRVGNL